VIIGRKFAADAPGDRPPPSSRSAFTHEPVLVRDYGGRERHRAGRAVYALEASVLEAARPRPVDHHHFPNRRRRAIHPAIALPSFDMSACTHYAALPKLRDRTGEPDEARADAIWVCSIISNETAAVESETTQIPLGISELGVAALTRVAQG
jgi:hypothetical protein